MAVDVAIENDVYVTQLRDALGSGEIGLSDVPPLLKAILKDGRWKSRRLKTDEMANFDRFEEFVKAEPLRGLGGDIELIKRMCSADNEALKLIDREVTPPPGNPTGANQHSREAEGITSIRSNSRGTHQGTTKLYALRVLGEKRPDLLDRVIAGGLSPHAAMVEAGFREKSITIPSDPENAARRLAKHFAGDRLDALIASLATYRGTVQQEIPDA